MKNFAYFILFIFAFSISFSSCDLFGDDEHCQYEANESKIWTPSNHFVYVQDYSSNPYYIMFEFNLGSNFYKRSFQLNNVCPFGAIAVKVRLFEKESIIGPRPIMYIADICESVQTAEGWNYKMKKEIHVYNRVSNTELRGEGATELLGLPESGGRNFFVTLTAKFEKGLFNSPAEMEAWAKENITRIEFYSDFYKYD
jgi:hypothetical protein